MQRNRMIAAFTIVALSGFAVASANAAEREQVRAVVNLIASVKMPYPERSKCGGATSIFLRRDRGWRCSGFATSLWRE
jgi:hypothetical protein